MIIQVATVGWVLLLAQVEGQPGEESAVQKLRDTPEQDPSPEPPSPPAPAQAPSPAQPPVPAQASAQAPAVTDLKGLLVPEEPQPALRYDEPVLCVRLPPTQQVPSGQYRMQCDPETHRCLVAPAYELDSSGEETRRPLLRTSFCDRSEPALGAQVQEGYRFVPAVAESPPGWYRDGQGRVMQFNFDLHRRFYMGGAWSPLMRQGEEARTDRFRVDFGIQTEFPTGQEEQRLHRLAFLESELYPGEENLDITLIRYDFNVERKVPLFRITTFFGKPRRFDVGLNLGFWSEAIHQEIIEREDSELSLLTWLALHGTLDLWHSEDLVSFVRLRAGAGLERDRTNALNTVVPTVALEGDLTLDVNGFHHLIFGVEAEKVLLAEEVTGRPLRPERLKARVGYELILLAINDQPLSLVADGRGGWRNDMAGVSPKWEWSANAGLRVSLWAPARRSAPMASAR
ncbi:hypothetical protein POL68_14155 [Stigmatella sp. ncwal1]|uniref:Uncharacterized protein n=1 Tax=Stigmatella ashevillensis TaxID=2995309 RepID=A0ABT5D971_9BACT|nr:hypothetical protein [Stigmatella ashevillena]MDC0709610.1 hypothetical protein [Stigmatella ashevillena]